MKKPRPKPPQGAPADTVWVGGPMPWFSMCILIAADNLVPDDVTQLLGVAPRWSQQKGKPGLTPNGKHLRTGKFGQWALELTPTEASEWDAPVAITTLLGKVPADPMIWDTLSSYAKVRLAIALSLESFNQGLSFDSSLLRLVADRKMKLDLEIYAGDIEDLPFVS